MNLLIFVMSLIMLMASITYSSLGRFVKAEVQAHEWQERIRAQAREKYNRSLYDRAPSKPDGKEKEKVPEDKGPRKENGRGTLSGQFLLNPTFRNAHQGDLIKFGELFKSIARRLYHEQPFFKNLERERPQFLDEIMREIVDISERDKPIANFDALMLKKWSDPNLKRAFSLMLAETPAYQRPVHEPIEKEEPEEERDESDASVNGLVSLNYYFHFNYKDKIRLWLAPRPVLMAIFNNTELVDSLIVARKRLYKSLMAQHYKEEEIAKSLRESYGNKSPYESFIDYTVTKTRPKK